MKKLTPADDSATRPIRLPNTAPRARQQVRASATGCAEHGWTTASRHSTSLGTVVYSACATCGAYRAELLEARALFPEPISRAIASAPAQSAGA
ncbi:hypothetical protein [Pseudoclavibacter terrae]|uniref:hypothetical protein n=1 Tax=Pseudoclavibacter terrae TaxID=1530195 RepID=UPI00232DB9B2|nr:hypothetical protein [Pseudoclavibacter terrae]